MKHPEPAPTFVVRFAGMSLSALGQLRFDQTMAQVDEIRALDGWLKAQAASLSEALFAVIGAATHDKRLQQRLIRLRRAVFNLQTPKPGDRPADLAEALPQDLAERLGDWMARIERRAALRAGGDAQLQAEWDSRRAALRMLARDLSFQQGLLLASATLYQHLRRWLAAGPDDPDHADRKLELGLLQYIARMSAKTSPFSTFTLNSYGEWVDAEVPISYRPQHWRRRSGAEINRYIVRRIAQELARWPEVRAALTVQANSSAVVEGETLCFVKRQDVEQVQKIRLPATLRSVLAIVGEAGPLSYAGLTELLAGEQGAARYAEIGRLLDQLIDLGVLDLHWNIPDQSVEYLQLVIAHLRPIRSARVAALLPPLEQIQSLLHSYGQTAEPDARAAVIEALAEALEQVYQRLAINQDGSRTPAKNIFYENSVADGLELRFGRAAWQPLLDTLALLQRLEPAFDVYMPRRLAATDFFLARYGQQASAGLLAFYETCTREAHLPDMSFLEAHTRAAARGAAQPELASSNKYVDQNPLKQLRQELRQWIGSLPADAQGVRRIDPAALEQRIAGRLDTPLPQSSAFYLQIGSGPAGPWAVVNGMQTGWGRPLARVRRWDAHSGAPEQWVAAGSATEADTPLLAGLGGVFGANVGLQFVQPDYELVYPGYVSALPCERQIPLSDLQVVYDLALGRLALRSARLQRAILPLHLSMAADVWLPPVYRFILSIFGAGPTNLTPVDLGPAGEDGQPQRFSPRLCLGPLVLERATWELHPSQVPLREKGESAFAYLLRLQDWLEAHSIPQQCFVRVPFPLPSRDSADDEAAPQRQLQGKPLYVDFRSYLSVMLFERTVRLYASQVTIQEMLPGEQEAWLADEHGPYVAELVIELNREASR
jgi:hypothetical protein